MSISLGDISFGLGPDTSRLKKAISDIRAFGTEVSNAAKRQADGARQAEAAMRRQEAATIRALMKVQNFQDALARVGANNNLGKTTTELNRLVKAMTDGQLSALQFQRANERFNVGMNNANRQLRQFTDGQRAQAQADRDAAAAAQAAERAVLRQESAIFSATSAVERYVNAVKRANAPGSFATGAQGNLATLQKALSDPNIDMTARQRALQAFAASMADSQAKLRNYNQSMALLGQLSKDSASAIKTQEAALMKQSAALFTATEAVKKYEAAVQRSGAPTTLVSGPQAALGQLQGALANPNISARQRQGALQSFQAQMNSARAELSKFNAVNAPINTAVSLMRQLSAASVLVAGPLSGISARIAVLSHAMNEFNASTVAAIAGTAAGAYAFVKLGEAAIDTAKKLQQVELTLTGVTGSNTIARAEMTYLADVADRAGVKFDTLAKQYGQMEAAAKGTSVEGQRMRDIFEAIVFTGSKLGLSSQEVEGALIAVQQAMTKGILLSEEIQKQLGNRLPGAMQALAAAMGTDPLRLKQMMASGEITLGFLTKFADELKKRYGVDTTKNVETIVAAENRFANAVLAVTDAFDKAIGVSSAYQTILEKMRTGLLFLADNMQTVLVVAGALGGAIAGAFSITIIQGVLSLGRAIVTAAVAMASLNVAVAANPFGLIVSILGRVAGAVFGVVAAQKLLSQSISQTQLSYLRSLPAVDAYIKAQDQQLTRTKNITDEYVKQYAAVLGTEKLKIAYAEQEVATLDAQLKRLQELNNAPQPFGVEPVDSSRQIEATQRKLEVARAGLDSYKRSAEEASKTLDKLTSIQKKQADLEAHPVKDPLKPLTNSQEVTLKKARDQINLLKAQYGEIYQAPAQQDFLKTQREITKAVEQYEDTLQRSLGNNPQGKSQIAGLVKDYREWVTKLKEGQAYLKVHESFFQGMEKVFSSGLDQAMGQFVDNIVEGKQAFQDFGNVAQAVMKDLLKTFLTLSVMNPLKNALFGTNYTTLGGTAGMGGLLSDPMGGLMKLFAARGGVYGYGGQIQRFASGGIGGIARQRTRVEFGEGSVPEAYVPVPSGKIPVELGGSTGGMEVHIHHDGTTSTEKRSRGAGGKERLDVFIKSLAVTAMLDDLTTNGPYAKSHAGQYGLNRARGAV